MAPTVRAMIKKAATIMPTQAHSCTSAGGRRMARTSPARQKERKAAKGSPPAHAQGANDQIDGVQGEKRTAKASGEIDTAGQKDQVAQAQAPDDHPLRHIPPVEPEQDQVKEKGNDDGDGQRRHHQRTGDGQPTQAQTQPPNPQAPMTRVNSRRGMRKQSVPCRSAV